MDDIIYTVIKILVLT